jgi:hypothetical protein
LAQPLQLLPVLIYLQLKEIIDAGFWDNAWL